MECYNIFRNWLDFSNRSFVYCSFFVRSLACSTTAMGSIVVGSVTGVKLPITTFSLPLMCLHCSGLMVTSEILEIDVKSKIEVAWS